MFSGFIATDFTDFYSNQPHLLSGGPGEMAKGPDVQSSSTNSCDRIGWKI